jgi:hypothetical protein
LFSYPTFFSSPFHFLLPNYLFLSSLFIFLFLPHFSNSYTTPPLLFLYVYIGYGYGGLYPGALS